MKALKVLRLANSTGKPTATTRQYQGNLIEHEHPPGGGCFLLDCCGSGNPGAASTAGPGRCNHERHSKTRAHATAPHNTARTSSGGDPDRCMGMPRASCVELRHDRPRQPQALARAGRAGGAGGGYGGQVVYLYAFDVAYEMNRRPVDRLLGQPVAEFAPGASKRQPAAVVLLPPADGPPAAARAADRPRAGPAGAERSSCCPSGRSASPSACRSRSTRSTTSSRSTTCASATARTCTTRSASSPRTCGRELRPLLRPPDRAAPRRGGVHRLLHQLPASTAGAARRPDARQLPAPRTGSQTNRREIAALLTEEPDPTHCSEQEAEESTGRYSATTTATSSSSTGTRPWSSTSRSTSTRRST